MSSAQTTSLSPKVLASLSVAHSALLSDYRGLLGAAIPAAVVAPIIAEDAQRWLAPTMCPDGRPVQATLSATPLRDGAVPPGQELLCWRRALVARDPLSAATLARSLSVSARPLRKLVFVHDPPPPQSSHADEWFDADDPVAPKKSPSQAVAEKYPGPGHYLNSKATVDAPGSADIAALLLRCRALSNIESLWLEAPAATAGASSQRLLPALAPQLLRLSVCVDRLADVPKDVLRECVCLRSISIALMPSSSKSFKRTLPSVVEHLSALSSTFLTDVALDGLQALGEPSVPDRTRFPETMRRLSLHWGGENHGGTADDLAFLSGVLSEHTQPLELSFVNMFLADEHVCPVGRTLHSVRCVTHLHCGEAHIPLVLFPKVVSLRTAVAPHYCDECSAMAGELSVQEATIDPFSIDDSGEYWRCFRVIKVLDLTADLNDARCSFLQPEDIPCTLTTLRIRGGLRQLALHMIKHSLVSKIKRIECVGNREFLGSPDVATLRSNGCTVEYVSPR